MDININMHMNLLNTPIPNFFIDNHMVCTKPVYSLIYIYIYKEYLYGKKKLDLSALAQKFDIMDSDVIKCLNYWQDKNLIEYKQIENSLFIKFVFLNNGGLNKKKISRIASYTPEELAFWEKNEKISGLFRFARNILQRLLSHSDLNALFGMYNDLKLPFDVIKILLEYCASQGHTEINYIEKVAINWAENEIFSLDNAKKKIGLFDNTDELDINNSETEKLFDDVKNTLVVRNLNPAQRELISSWYDSGVIRELIIEACNVVMLNIGVPNFKYISKIIRSWQRNNIKTVEEARKLENCCQDFKLKKIAAKNRFANFEQREWDFDELKKITCDTED